MIQKSGFLPKMGELECFINASTLDTFTRGTVPDPRHIQPPLLFKFYISNVNVRNSMKLKTSPYNMNYHNHYSHHCNHHCGHNFTSEVQKQQSMLNIESAIAHVSRCW